MAGILAFGALSEGALAAGSLHAIALARTLKRRPIGGALIGSNCAAAAASLAASGCENVFVVDDRRLEPYRAELFVAAAEAIIQRHAPDIVLFAETTDTAEWVPLLAGRLGAALASGCTRLAFDGDTLIATRPVCGGAVIGDYAFDRRLCFAILTPGAATLAQVATPCSIEPVTLPDITSRVSLLEELPQAAGTGPALKKAKVVVAGGLGLGSKENWRLVEDAASSLGAAVGATRAVVELGWIPSTQQVGFSGQKIGPDLYIAVGISGAVHHLAGLARAKTIVAINKDPQAGIFRAARFGVVGDVREVLPAFVARVRELRAGQG
jgi:electron transfer flavoprotein alpha subunit